MFRLRFLKRNQGPAGRLGARANAIARVDSLLQGIDQGIIPEEKILLEKTRMNAGDLRDTKESAGN